MWVDRSLEMSVAQALTATADSTDHINLGGDFDVGAGAPLYWVVQVDVVLDDTDANETYVMHLETDNNSAFSSGTDLLTFTFTRADPQGTVQWTAVPNANEQFLQTRYVLGGTTPSGSFSSWITHEQPPSWVSLPDAVN